jgi:aerobic-type carbon monoxide dehydrogenase small subunit (CoxS/CutS family)
VSSSAQITFDLPEPIPVQLKVYDLLGREVTTLTDRTMRAGTHHVRLNGRSLTSGTYLVRLKAGADVRTTKLTVVR